MKESSKKQILNNILVMIMSLKSLKHLIEDDFCDDDFIKKELSENSIISLITILSLYNIQNEEEYINKITKMCNEFVKGIKND